MTQPTCKFLGLDGPQGAPDTAQYGVLPIPYEGTVGYKAGTAAGPAAILEASQQVELFDEELLMEFASPGIVTYEPVDPADDPGEQMQRIKAAAQPIVEGGKFLLSLGGEHSITGPLVDVVAAECHPLSVLQIDAHADLRNNYLGTMHSHACVMRRVLESTCRICQVGVRSYSREEYLACPEEIAALITPQVIAEDPDWIDRALALLGEHVYVTVDMDGLDPSIAPGVGTPEPGGLTWRQVLGLLRQVCLSRHVVAADIVEVRPIPPNHITEFAAARLACKIIAYTQQRHSSSAATAMPPACGRSRIRPSLRASGGTNTSDKLSWPGRSVPEIGATDMAKKKAAKKATKKTAKKSTKKAAAKKPAKKKAAKKKAKKK